MNINEVTITRVDNGFMIHIENGYPNKIESSKTFVATSIKDSYGFGSISVVNVLDTLFNPRDETTRT
jgi:hypothetical protein